MDSKILRFAVLLSITAVALVVLVVYAVNVDRFRGKGAGAADAAASDTGTATEEVAEEEGPLQVLGDGFVAYGDQIGDQPRAFLYDESFFDPMQDVQSIREGEEESLTLKAQASGSGIHITVVNARGGLEEGTAFRVLVQQGASREKVWTDTDRDGQIDLEDQAAGTYRLYLLEAAGYQIPSTPVVVQVEGEEGSKRPDAAATAGSSNGAGAGGSAPAAASTGGTAGDGASTGGTAGDGASGAAATGSTWWGAEPGSSATGSTWWGPEPGSLGTGATGIWIPESGAAGMGSLESGPEQRQQANKGVTAR